MPWTSRTVAGGLGSLENLAFDGRGGLLLSATDRRSVERLTPDGRQRTLVSGVVAPGGLYVRRDTLFFNTGNSAAAALLGSTDGTVERFELDTGRRTLYAGRLTAPNGLAFLDNGDAVVSRALGDPGVTRIPAARPDMPDRGWARTDANGLVLDPTGDWLYTVGTFRADSPLLRVRVADPRQIETVARLGAARGPDDLTADRDGNVYIAANATGEVFRVDAADRSVCRIAAGAGRPSSVRFGCGPGWARDHLYVSNFDGTVRELSPPASEARATLGPLARVCPSSAGETRRVRVRFRLQRYRSARVFNRTRRLRVSVRVSDGRLAGVRLWLRRRGRTYAARRVSGLGGERRLTVPARREVRRGRYRIVLEARDPARRRLRATAIVRFRR